MNFKAFCATSQGNSPFFFKIDVSYLIINFELPATYRPYSLIEVGDSWEQSVLDYSGIHHSQRILLFTKLHPQSLRFLMVFSSAYDCMRYPSAGSLPIHVIYKH